MFGHPIILGEDFCAVSHDDVFARWNPKGSPTFTTLAHPVQGTPEPDLTPTAMFGGYPMVLSSNGLILADDQVSPFLASLANDLSPNWHRDIFSRVGIGAAKDSLLYMNVGGEGALAGLAAIDARSGKPVWEIAPEGFPTEPLQVIHRAKERQPTIAETHALEAANRATGKNLTMPRLFNAQVTMGIVGRHGHWDNPGLVLQGSTVFGQVGSRVLAVDGAKGSISWGFDLRPGEVARSIAASKDYLFLSLPTRLVALSLSNGEFAWSTPTPRAGTISIADGRLFLAIGNPSGKDGGELLVFGSTTTEVEESFPGLPPP